MIEPNALEATPWEVEEMILHLVRVRYSHMLGEHRAARDYQLLVVYNDSAVALHNPDLRQKIKWSKSGSAPFPRLTAVAAGTGILRKINAS